MNHPVVAITEEMTVNEIVQKYPRSLPVFKAFGIDTCCGGALALGHVLVKHGLENGQVLDALADVIAEK